MARIRLETEIKPDEFLVFRKLADAFPDIRADMLSHVGDKGTYLLFNTFLNGQELRYKSMKDKKNRRTVSYTIAKRASAVKIRSYPANFFEKPNKRPDSGKFIITRKFRPVMESALNGILNEYDRIYLQRKLDKVA
jgi:hypothetical protein